MVDEKDCLDYTYRLATLEDVKNFFINIEFSHLKLAWLKQVDNIMARPKYQIADCKSRNSITFNFDKIVLYDVVMKQYFVAASLPDT